ncbi:hypothetical protein GCM10008995_27040 [Halobellus salinus]|uniref:Uncharacterized protein n=1 Tax=Halobellus salinus TaxID=931585 RepID=A0A830ERX9_9EURY|nr:hypothetical protein [Halobellus salinus]GGJ15800.1 hypothetical protein GCM10008995_27040 [Halobellus salinus]SMP30360.1 hypothetical protein SAMN06265347_11623 [Halobellus salinus]
MSFTTGGSTLRGFAEAVLADYDVRDPATAEIEADPATRGWAPVDGDDAPGGLRKNPAGEQSRAYARILIDGAFNENLEGFGTELSNGDRVAVVTPFVFCVSVGKPPGRSRVAVQSSARAGDPSPSPITGRWMSRSVASPSMS